MRLSKLKDLISDLPKGPLDKYRVRARFDWKLLKLNLEGEEGIVYQVNIITEFLILTVDGAKELTEKKKNKNK